MSNLTPTFFRSSEFSSIPGVKHLFFTKNLPQSSHVYVRTDFEIRNLSGNREEVTSKNRTIAIRCADFPITHLSILNEVHSNRVVVVDGLMTETLELDADAQVTKKSGITLGILTADCVPVLFADGKNHVIGAAHAGWKGALEGVLQNTVSEMGKLGSLNSETVALIGPCIHQQDYEVGPEFLDRFLQNAAHNRIFFINSKRKGHFLFDLPSYVTSILKRLNLKSVYNIGKNTFTDPQNLFSYRRTKQENTMLVGNNLSLICLE